MTDAVTCCHPLKCWLRCDLPHGITVRAALLVADEHCHFEHTVLCVYDMEVVFCQSSPNSACIYTHHLRRCTQGVSGNTSSTASSACSSLKSALTLALTSVRLHAMQPPYKKKRTDYTCRLQCNDKPNVIQNRAAQLQQPYSHCISSICWNADWLQNLQDHFEQAISCSYETVLLGHRSAQPQLIAASTINVAKAGQRYVEMLAEVVARLVKDGHGRPAAKVRPMQLLWHSMHLFTEQPAVLYCCCTVMLPIDGSVMLLFSGFVLAL